MNKKPNVRGTRATMPSKPRASGLPEVKIGGLVSHTLEHTCLMGVGGVRVNSHQCLRCMAEEPDAPEGGPIRGQGLGSVPW